MCPLFYVVSFCIITFVISPLIWFSFTGPPPGPHFLHISTLMSSFPKHFCIFTSSMSSPSHLHLHIPCPQHDDAAINLMEMRFHIPTSELAGDDPVENFQQRVLSKASIITATGDALAIFREVQCLTPRQVQACLFQCIYGSVLPFYLFILLYFIYIFSFITFITFFFLFVLLLFIIKKCYYCAISLLSIYLFNYFIFYHFPFFTFYFSLLYFIFCALVHLLFDRYLFIY